MDTNLYVTIVGITNYYGKTPFKIGNIVKLAKEPSNEIDSEAIVTLPYIAP